MAPPPPGKLALITGATGGIGRATALAFSREGYTLALHYNTASPTTVTELLEAVSAAQDSSSAAQPAQAFQADLSSFSAVRKLHADVVAALGDPQILFLNAGSTGGLSGVQSLNDVDIDVFEATWRVNTAAPYLLAQLCVPAMESKGWGRVVFNSSVAALTGGVVGPHYASSKAALHGLVHWMAGRLADKGVTVNAVAPALVEGTAMLPAGGEELAKSKL